MPDIGHFSPPPPQKCANLAASPGARPGAIEAPQIPDPADTGRRAAPHLPYLPGIDGLRAVAVLAVVLYHFGLPIRGGFVGVDVFFVISGFLIGGLLWRERRETGRIALGAFWMRRVRRLAPAYFTMAAVSAVAAWMILLPFEFREFGKSLIAATLWLSNVQFWREAGYFDAGSDTKVLLHTWSLSVEEQFYVVLPLLVAALGALRRGLAGLLVFLWGLSLAASVLLTPSEPVATFFLFPFRAWELLTGVLLAIWLQGGPRAVPAWVADAGLALVILSVLAVTATGFPGWQAVFPVAGAAMVIAGQGSGARTVAALSMRGPVFVGLISYSLYLWHWPVRVLSDYWSDGYAHWTETLGWLALTTVLSVASWALVERPLRRARIAPRRFVGGDGDGRGGDAGRRRRRLCPGRDAGPVRAAGAGPYRGEPGFPSGLVALRRAGRRPPRRDRDLRHRSGRAAAGADLGRQPSAGADGRDRTGGDGNRDAGDHRLARGLSAAVRRHEGRECRHRRAGRRLP